MGGSRCGTRRQGFVVGPGGGRAVPRRDPARVAVEMPSRSPGPDRPGGLPAGQRRRAAKRRTPTGEPDDDGPHHAGGRQDCDGTAGNFVGRCSAGPHGKRAGFVEPPWPSLDLMNTGAGAVWRREMVLSSGRDWIPAGLCLCWHHPITTSPVSQYRSTPPIVQASTRNEAHAPLGDPELRSSCLRTARKVKSQRRSHVSAQFRPALPSGESSTARPTGRS